MSIWRYADAIKEVSLVRTAMSLSNCPFCGTSVELLRDDAEKRGRSGEYETDVDRYWVCQICGWWKGYRSYRHTDHAIRSFSESGAAAALKTLDIADISLPVEEVRSYLAANYHARLTVHPRSFELVVASVFRDHGYLSEATAYSNDGGIDVVLRGEDGHQVGVQVKRYKNSIQVEQIRSFAGALLLKDFTKGIFVTTSTFQSGAPDISRAAVLRGIAIELIDAPRFIEYLKVAQREMYKSNRDLSSSLDSEAFVQMSYQNYGKFRY
jgi:restriction system protein